MEGAQALIPDGPFNVQVILPVGAIEPFVPVTVAVNVSTELRETDPAPVSAIAGAIGLTTTTADDAGASPL